MAILVPFTEPHVRDLHLAHLRPGINCLSDTRRIIIDLSWAKGQSVNSGVDSDKHLNTDFFLTYPLIQLLKYINLLEGARYSKWISAGHFAMFLLSKATWIFCVYIGITTTLTFLCYLDSNMDLPFFSIYPTLFASL